MDFTKIHLSYQYGMGFYSPTSTTMDKFRKAIDVDENKFLKSISFYHKQRCFTLEGDKYKKVFDSSKTAEINNWYQRKNFYLICRKENDKLLLENGLIKNIAEEFNQLSLLYNFIINNCF